MEIWHRIFFNAISQPQLRRGLDDLQIEYETNDGIASKDEYIYFDIKESDESWEKLKPLLTNVSDVYNTQFSDEEIATADWVRAIPAFEQGYPQPKDNWVPDYPDYELLCKSCGTYQQIKTFEIEKEPKLEGNDFMTFYWVYQLFCTPEVIKVLKQHKISGFEIWDILLYKTKEASQIIKQLYVPHIAKASLVKAENLQRTVCQECNTTKYYPHMRGIMHFKDVTFSQVNQDILLSYEWFGAGAPYREILISNKFAKLILENEWKGLQLKAVELV